ncbi:replication-relaxation family protein [Bradyrhizobium liaoningense]|uniref:replication-relaxation family protein n=1 Tax=Bradyrhizobium liaoningense TaxID=43992 RepID=UPI002013A7BF|nr:replication-relaxation family protein [Bradyrhizobium liaoningense]
MRSSHIAALVGRSLDRTNDRLCRLYHAGFVDRPRAQLDYYPTSGSAPMVYALGDLGAQLLSDGGAEFANCEWSRKNREAGRPFIEHQLEIVEFHIALERSTRGRSDVRLIHPEEIVASSPEHTRKKRNPFARRATISQGQRAHDLAVAPDLVFGLMFPDGSRRCFMVEIDRGTMPIMRADLAQTSFVRKMQAYLAAHATKQHEAQFGWKTFRVLTVTTDRNRTQSIREALRELNVPHIFGPSLFLFAVRDELRASDPIEYAWEDGAGRQTKLI